MPFRALPLTSLPVSQPLQQCDDSVLFGGEKLQGGGYPSQGLSHADLPPLPPPLPALAPTTGPLLQPGLLLLPPQDLLQERAALLQPSLLRLAGGGGAGGGGAGGGGAGGESTELLSVQPSPTEMGQSST